MAHRQMHNEKCVLMFVVYKTQYKVIWLILCSKSHTFTALQLCYSTVWLVRGIAFKALTAMMYS